MAQFAVNMQRRIEAAERGERVDETTQAASGLAIAMSAAKLALMRVVRRFFLPFDPARV